MWLFFLLVLWVGIGTLLLYLKSRPAGKQAYLRIVDKSVYNQSEFINVTLKLTSPVITSSLTNEHDIILILDHSASMGSAPGSPLMESVRAMENFVQQLPKAYHVGIILFDHEAQILCHLTANKTEVLNTLKTIGSGGSTHLHLALDQCIEALDEGRENVKKTLILLSDGGSDRKAADN